MIQSHIYGHLHQGCITKQKGQHQKQVTGKDPLYHSSAIGALHKQTRGFLRLSNRFAILHSIFPSNFSQYSSNHDRRPMVFSGGETIGAKCRLRWRPTIVHSCCQRIATARWPLTILQGAECSIARHQPLLQTHTLPALTICLCSPPL